MSSAPGGVSFARLKRRALSIGAVKAFDHAMQFLLPLVLVRCLDTATFGEYRLLWLALGTIMSFATLNMCGTLYYFVPRSEPQRKRLYVHQTLIFLALSGVACGFFVSPANPLLPAPIRPLGAHGLLVPAFVTLWVVTDLLDRLPTVDERIAWQAYATVGVSALRVALMAVGAWFTGDFHIMLWLLLAVALTKTGLLAFYVWRRHGLGRPWFEWATFSEQFRHSAPLEILSLTYPADILAGHADLSGYKSQTSKNFANIQNHATEWVFDGSDQMPAAVGSNAFWKQATAWITGQSTKDTVDKIEAAWPKS